MRCRTIITIGTAALLLAACAGAPPAPPQGGAATAEAPPATAEPAAVAPTGVAGEPLWEEFDAASFSSPATITNRWMPLKPGTRYTYEGTTLADDGTLVPHRIEINVTGLTKQIGGIDAVVTWDLDYSDEQLVEAELAFFAQDDKGNVWRMGEYPEEYEEGQFVVAPTWIHGLEDARAGIAMPAEPQLGGPSYSQGWGPAVDWTDRGKIDQMGVETCVPVDCFKDVLVVAETSQAEPDAFQLKYWAPGVGNVRTGWRGGGEKTQEVLELTGLAELSAAELAEVHQKAFAMEQHAYEVSHDVYALTPPIVDPATGTAPAAPQATAAAAAPAATAPPVAAAGEGAEVVVYASDLAPNALYEFEFSDDPAAAGGKLVGTPNTGGHLDPPPENDPHVMFTIQVQGGVPYACWIHMKVGAPMGESQANMVWVQASGAVDQGGLEVLKPDSASYLTATGPQQEGWSWVPCVMEGSAEPALITFASNGEARVRVQAGMEGVGFDQFVLSAARFIDEAPSEAIIAR